MNLSGWRVSEFLRLHREDVHLDKGYMMGGNKTAAGKRRIVPIIDAARPYIQYFYDHPKDGFSTPEAPLVQNKIGRPYDRNMWRRKHFDRALKLCGIEGPYTPHSTRHTFASLSDRVHMAPEDLQSIIGHKSYETTANIYIHPDIKALTVSASALDTIITTSKLLATPPAPEKQKTP